MNRRFRGLALIVLALVTGCGLAERGRGHGGRVTVRWTGADTAAFSAPATAEWCDSLNLLEIRAFAGDTGVGLAIYRHGGVAPGAYRIRPPDSAGAAPPSAAIGLRWYSQTAIQGFQGTGGDLSLERAPDGSLVGTFSAKARGIAGNTRLTVTGAFEGLLPRPATRGCYAPKPESPDTAEGQDSTDGVD